MHIALFRHVVKSKYTRALTFETWWGGCCILIHFVWEKDVLLMCCQRVANVCSMLMRFVWEQARSKEVRMTQAVLQRLRPSLLAYKNQAKTLTFQNFWQDLLDFLLALHQHSPILLPEVVEGLLPHGSQVYL